MPQDYDSLNLGDVESRVFGSQVIALADGDALTLEVRGMALLTIITAAGATATWSRVDAVDADAHDAATSTTVDPETVSTITVDWPFVRVSVAGGGARIGVA